MVAGPWWAWEWCWKLFNHISLFLWKYFIYIYYLLLRLPLIHETMLWDILFKYAKPTTICYFFIHYNIYYHLVTYWYKFILSYLMLYIYALYLIFINQVNLISSLLLHHIWVVMFSVRNHTHAFTLISMFIEMEFRNLNGKYSLSKSIKILSFGIPSDL